MDRDGPLPETMLARVGAEVAAGLAHAHDRGVVHRDVKPQQRPHRRVREPQARGLRHRPRPGRGRHHRRLLDATGSYLGTASYSSPEQLQGEKITPKSDIYALGATLYHAAVGEPPFVGAPIEVASQQVSTRPTTPARARRLASAGGSSV